MKRNVIIIGSGPAGWTAAIYTARANLKPLVFEGALSYENQQSNTLPMGQLALTTEVENYPGFPKGDLTEYLKSSVDHDRLQYLPPHRKEGVAGPELVELMRQQAINFGAEIVTEDIVSIDASTRPFRLAASDGKTYQASAVIVATGARANYLNLPSEEAYKNRGVSACAVCDGALPRFRNQPVAVVGGGDTAMEDAVYLANFASKVYLIHRRDEFRASKFMVHKALSNEKIEPLYSRVVEEVLGDKTGVTGLKLKSTKGEPDLQIDCAGMFVLIGHTPNTAFLEGTVELDAKKYIVWKERTATSVEGIFAAGDCADSVYRQAITAAASGCQAAIDAERWLVHQES
ncbi:MAG: thioredoxin-disulfide reductase [Planctomycetia bacterium]|nr:thioredoxin-disulfide reductase [Planctomycetia bacterium]